MAFIFVVLLLGGGSVLFAVQAQTKPLSSKDSGLFFERSRIAIVPARTGTPITFDVDVAHAPEQKAHGLMYRTAVPPLTGMLFVFDEPERAAFWMKNTAVSLDMIFIDESHKIVSIAVKTIPGDLTPHAPPVPVISVLEIAAGEAQRLGIDIGDSLQFNAN